MKHHPNTRTKIAAAIGAAALFLSACGMPAAAPAAGKQRLAAARDWTRHASRATLPPNQPVVYVALR